MGRIPPHIIDEIMQTARVEEVVGEFVNLKRAGSNLKGLSPFTDEKTPSFVVSPAKQLFKCFSTGKGGSVVTFLMEKEHYSYPEALRWLADKYGIQLPEEEEQTAEQIAAVTERESLQIINEFAKNHFQHSLHETDEGKAVGLSYFLERGFRMDIIQKFNLGYCLNKGNDFTEAALSKGYKLEYLEKVGLVKSKDDRHFDFFRGRVLFPIHSVTGRVLGFGGRTLLADKKIAKYFNSPESIIYNKSEILYGLYFAKGDIIKYDNCFLVEGYTDVISMHQAGVTNVVSSSGTSLTHGQIKLIRRYTQNITILYDGDAAGIKASFRGIDLILEEGLNVRVVLFPDGDDPDSYSKKVGSAELERYIKENTKDFLSFKAELLLGDGVSDPGMRVKLIHDIVHSISLIPDQITRSIYANEISNRFDIDLQVINQELGKLRKNQLAKQLDEPAISEFTITPAQPKEQAQTAQKKPKKFFAENDLIRILVKYGQYAIEVEQIDEKGEKEKIEVSVAELICHELLKDDLTFENEIYAQLHQLISAGLTEGTLYKPSFFMRHENQEIVKVVSEIETENYELSNNWLLMHSIDTNTELDKLKRAVLDGVYAFKSEKIQHRIAEIRTELSEAIEMENQSHIEDLLVEQVTLEKIKMALSAELGRIILR
ncbi:MAG: DNA primase [Crocinitomicaceae bacterium]|nr:MAG: DNA primase [Crocinitomicaceae bacterium]